MTTKKTKTWLIIAGILILIILFWVASCKVIINNTTTNNYVNPSNNPTEEIVKSFPSINARQKLITGTIEFNKEYGTTLEIIDISYENPIYGADQTAKEMLQSSLVVSGFDPYSFSLNESLDLSSYPIPDSLTKFNNLLKISDTNAILKTLKLNMENGDFKVAVKIRNKKTNKIYTSINSISQDGTRISGILFLTTIKQVDNIIYSIRPNTNCPIKLIAAYVFTDIPKISVEICVRAICDQIGLKNGKTKDSVFDCRITEIQPFTGPFCDFKIFPDPEKNPNPRGYITREGCVASFSWAYATGFKSIKVSNNATGQFELEGLIGRAAKGSFQVCDRCNSDPEICR